MKFCLIIDMISFKSIVKTRYRNHKIESVIESIMNQPDLSRTSTSCGGLYHFVTAEYFSGSSWIDMDWDCITSRINSDWCCQICFGSNARSCTDLYILRCLHSQTLDVRCCSQQWICVGASICSGRCHARVWRCQGDLQGAQHWEQSLMNWLKGLLI